jgi:hypothetical protein
VRGGGFSRAGYYRFLDPAKPAAEDMDLRGELQKTALGWPSYGSRWIKRELKTRGWEVSRKRVQRLMREDNPLCVVKRKFVVTTDSAHGRKVYPNLAASLILTGVTHSAFLQPASLLYSIPPRRGPRSHLQRAWSRSAYLRSDPRWRDRYCAIGRVLKLEAEGTRSSNRFPFILRRSTSETVSSCSAANRRPRSTGNSLRATL